MSIGTRVHSHLNLFAIAVTGIQIQSLGSQKFCDYSFHLDKKHLGSGSVQKPRCPGVSYNDSVCLLTRQVIGTACAQIWSHWFSRRVLNMGHSALQPGQSPLQPGQHNSLGSTPRQ